MNKKICVVGAGHWGKNHINTLHSLGCLKGVVDPRQKELDYSLSRYSQINTYTSLEYSLKDNYDGYFNEWYHITYTSITGDEEEDPNEEDSRRRRLTSEELTNKNHDLVFSKQIDDILSENDIVNMK